MEDDSRQQQAILADFEARRATVLAESDPKDERAAWLKAWNGEWQISNLVNVWRLMSTQRGQTAMRTRSPDSLRTGTVVKDIVLPWLLGTESTTLGGRRLRPALAKNVASICRRDR